MEKNTTITNEIMLADIMLRLTAIEKILIDKNVLTKDELLTTVDAIANQVAQVVLEKAKENKDVSDFLSSKLKN